MIWRIDVADCGLIDVADLELATPRMQEGDIVLLDTGRARHVNTEKYMNHASLTAEAAEWLVKRGAKIVGVDFATPDLAARLRPPDFAFPVHYTLLSQGVLIAEHVTNLGGRNLAARSGVAKSTPTIFAPRLTSHSAASAVSEA